VHRGGCIAARVRPSDRLREEEDEGGREGQEALGGNRLDVLEGRQTAANVRGIYRWDVADQSVLSVIRDRRIEIEQNEQVLLC
jgi:hypothetical protein